MPSPYGGTQKFRYNARYGSPRSYSASAGGSTFDPFAPSLPNRGPEVPGVGYDRSNYYQSNPGELHPGVSGPPAERSKQENPYQTGTVTVPDNRQDTGRSAGPMPSGYDYPDDTGPGRDLPGSDMDSRVQKILAKYPGYKSIWDQSDPTGQILGEMRTEYMGTDPTKWANAQAERQRMDEARLRDLAMGDVQSARASAETNLAMRGGLSSGAQERLGMTGMESQANKLQELARGGMMARKDIDIADEGRKFQGRSGLATAGIGDVNSRNMWDLDRAKMEMDAMAAGYTADALSRGGGNPYADPRGQTATGLPDPLGGMVPGWARNRVLPVGANMFTDINAPVTNKLDQWSGGRLSRNLPKFG